MRISSFSLARSLLYRPIPRSFAHASRLFLSVSISLPLPYVSHSLFPPAPRTLSLAHFFLSRVLQIAEADTITPTDTEILHGSPSFFLSLFLFFYPPLSSSRLFSLSLSLSLSDSFRTVRWGSFTIPRLLSLYRVHLIPVFFFSLSFPPFFFPFFFRSTVLHEDDDDDRNRETRSTPVRRGNVIRPVTLHSRSLFLSDYQNTIGAHTSLEAGTCLAGSVF